MEENVTETAVETTTPEPTGSPLDTPAQETVPAPAPEVDQLRRRLIDAEKARRKHERELKSREEALTSKERHIEERVKALEAQLSKAREAEQFVEELKKNPYAGVQKGVLNYEELTQAILNDGKLSPEKLVAQAREEMLAELKKRDEELAAIRKSNEDAEQRANQEKARAFAQRIWNECESLLSKNPEKYELTLATENGVEEVYEYMRLYAVQNNGDLPSVVEAADAIEAYFEKQVERVAKTRKLTKYFQPLEPSAAPKQTPKTESSARASALTNETATSPASPGDKMAVLPREEALEIIKQKLNAKLKAAKK